MRPTQEITAISQMGTTIAAAGTVTPTGVSWTDTYEPDVRLLVNVHGGAAGALIATLEQSNTVGSAYASLATLSCGSIAGVYSTDAFATMQYLRVVATATGGATPVSATLVGKKRTVI